ncbi:TPA: phenylalanine--tRNA ligase subunit beta [Candidatus Micrarchaeota archaeon]|nr:phenylalanine--tRNA ligase subunit beta [Candidatus Micrarchaeota archaeon]
MAVVEFYIDDLREMCGRMEEKKLIETLTNLGAPCEAGEGESKGKLIIEITPNRPDFFFIEGLTRAVNTFQKRKIPEYTAKKSDYVVIVDSSVEKIRPSSLCAVVKNLKLDARRIEYLIQAQEKLMTTIGRKTRKFGMGFFDLNKVVFPIKYTTRKPEDIVYRPLGYQKTANAREILTNHPKGIENRHMIEKFDRYPLYEDANGRVLVLIPIVNSEECGKIDERTNAVFIEVTGTDMNTIKSVMNILICSLIDIGGTAYSVEMKYPDKKFQSMQGLVDGEVELDLEFINKILGLELSKKDVDGLLARMGYKTSGKKVMTPPYRIDIMHFMDIVEDVAIAYGYEKFEPMLPDFFTSGKTIGKTESEIDKTLRGMGFLETVSPILTSPGSIKNAGLKQTKDAEVKNSKSEEFSIIRPALALSILECFARNKTKGLPQKFYEIGDRFVGGELERAVVFAVVDRNVSFADIRGYAQTLFEEIGLEFKIENAASEPGNELMDEEKSGMVMFDGEVRGRIGLVNEDILKRFNLQNKVAICEIVLD